jgi:hypothetical protein
MCGRRGVRTVSHMNVHELRVTQQTDVATGFALAVGNGDRAALREMLDPRVELRALTPSRAWSIDDADEVVDTMIGLWFGGERHVEEVESVVADVVGEVVRVGYRFRATTPDGPAVVEQQAYLAVDGGTIRSIRLVCSGYHPAKR